MKSLLEDGRKNSHSSTFCLIGEKALKLESGVRGCLNNIKAERRTSYNLNYYNTKMIPYL